MKLDYSMLLALLPAFLFTVAGTPLVGHISKRTGWMDQPNHRSSHFEPKPRIGGVAIVVGTLAGVIVSSGEFEWWMLGIGIGAVLVAITGFLDDLLVLGPAQKFLPQLASALIAVLLLDPKILVQFPSGTVIFSSEVSAVLAVVWIISVINAFNFLDGLDGLAAAVAIVSAIALAGLLPGAAPLLMPFAAALVGFLLWNFEPATIFMGDVGSQFVGYLLATAVLMPSPTDTGAVPVLFVFVPVLGDAAVTILRRLVRGTSPFSADRAHVFHGFMRALGSHRAVTILYSALTGLAGLAGLAYMHAGPTVQVLLLLSVALVLVGSFAVMAKVGLAVFPRVGLKIRRMRAYRSRGRMFVSHHNQQ